MKEDWEKWRERRLLLGLLYERRIKKKEKRTVTKLTFIMSTMHNSLPRIHYFNPYINPGIQVQFFFVLQAKKHLAAICMRLWGQALRGPGFACRKCL